MDYTPYLLGLAALFVVLVIFLIYRYRLTAWEDDTIHINEGEESTVGSQEAHAKKMAKVDLITKVLVILVVLYILGLTVLYAIVSLPS